MKQVFSIGNFYGSTRKQVRTSAFAFAEVEDLDQMEVPPHTHENAHFLFVKKQLCSSSATIYYPAGTTHSDHFYTAGERRFLTVSLRPETNKKLLEEINFIDYSVVFNSLEISWLGGRISRELQSPDTLSSIVLDGMANELLVYSARGLDNSEKAPAWLKSAHELIKDCCTGSITIAEIATTVGVHPLHLARTFRRFFNCSPGEFLRKCRIESASHLLLNSKEPLAGVALLSGFADQSQFTRSFKRATGITPAKFREIHNS
jgi:AraC family transcriptional regulator